MQEDKRLLGGVQALISQQPIPTPVPFQQPSTVECYELALKYRLAMKQSLEKSLVNVITRMKGRSNYNGLCLEDQA